VKDEQVRGYIALIVVATLVITAWLMLTNGVTALRALRLAAFNVE